MAPWSVQMKPSLEEDWKMAVPYVKNVNTSQDLQVEETALDGDISKKEMKRILRKMDFHLLPTVVVLYFLSFLDRGNIGNAAILGLQTDLGLVGNQYNWCLSIYFFSYCFFEPPSNFLLKKFRPSIYLPTIMVLWGIVMTLMGLCTNYSGLLAARWFLGLTEAGLFPGVAFWLSSWYPRYELQLRMAIFFSSVTVAGAFSGFLAAAIGKMAGVAGLAGWAWIFIIEGIATVLVAVLAYFTIYDWPESQKTFLTPEEQAIVVARVNHDYGSNRLPSDAPKTEQVLQSRATKWLYVKQVFTDFQLYTTMFIGFGIFTPLYGISLFLPTILNALGFGTTQTQLMTVPVYVLGCGICILQGKLADHFKMRSPFMVFSYSLMTIGYIMAAAAKGNPAITYTAVFIIAAGIYPCCPNFITWMGTNFSGAAKRAVAMATIIGIGNLAGIYASQMYRTQDKPGFTLGHCLMLMFIGMGWISLGLHIFLLKRINTNRGKLSETEIFAKYTKEELEDLGDKSPLFKYSL